MTFRKSIDSVFPRHFATAGTPFAVPGIWLLLLSLGVGQLMAASSGSSAQESGEVLDLMAEADRVTEQEAAGSSTGENANQPSEQSVESGSVQPEEAATEDSEETPKKEPNYGDPAEALVAVRGDAGAGLGILSFFEGKTVVVTSVSALEGSRRLLVNRADGSNVPIAGVAAVRGRDLALLAVNDEGLDLPYAELSFTAELDSKKFAGLLTPQGLIALSLEKKGKDGRYPVRPLETPVFAGTPVLVGGEVFGVYSPERSLGQEEIWPAGVEAVSPPFQWEILNLRTMAAEGESLEESYEMLSQIGLLLGVNRSKGALTLQRLVAAKDRLKDSLERYSQPVELNSARGRFIFSVRSALGTVETDLQEARLGFYSYFSPEIEAQIEMYSPIREKMQELSENPRSADSYAR